MKYEKSNSQHPTWVIKSYENNSREYDAKSLQQDLERPKNKYLHQLLRSGFQYIQSSIDFNRVLVHTEQHRFEQGLVHTEQHRFESREHTVTIKLYIKAHIKVYYRVILHEETKLVSAVLKKYFYLNGRVAYCDTSPKKHYPISQPMDKHMFKFSLINRTVL